MQVVMVSTELGACEWFVWDLRRSNLIDRGRLDQLVGEFLQTNPRAEPPALAEFLVGRGILSQFQADRLLQGKTQGFVLGPFTLMDALGAGSMGTVYKAQSKNDSNAYAVKVLPRRSMWNVRIARRKVRAFEQCRHPAVVPFVDVGTAGGMHYLAWPFVEGETLDKVVQRQTKLSASQAAQIALQVAEGLEICHQQGLFHGLLKPSNLLVNQENQIHILDFGIGCLLAETEGESLVDTMSTANSVASGLDCASPESIMDPTNLTPSGDQYSLGCVLYYCLSGQYPFSEGSAAEKMMAHQFKEPTPLRDLCPEAPAELIEVVEKLMKKAPEARYGSAAEVVEALRPLAGPLAHGARPATRPQPPRHPAAGAEAHRPAPAGESHGRSVAPSAPTPRPSSHVSLPSRNSLRGKPAPAPVAPEPAEDDNPERRIPGAQPEPPRTWEERLGPVGITVIAVVLCAIGWAITMFLF
jgi:serine/threonine-protein kinase